MGNDDKEMLYKVDTDLKLLTVEFKHMAGDLKEASTSLTKISESLESIQNCKEKVKKLESKMESIWFFVFMARNPKLCLLMGFGLVAIFQSDIRDLLWKLLV